MPENKARIGFSLPKDKLEKVQAFFKGKSSDEIILWVDEQITQIEKEVEEYDVLHGQEL